MVLELLVLTILFIIPGCFFRRFFFGRFFFGGFFFQTVFFFGPKKNPERRWLYPKPGVVIKEPQAPSLHSESTKKEGVDEGADLLRTVWGGGCLPTSTAQDTDTSASNPCEKKVFHFVSYGSVAASA